MAVVFKGKRDEYKESYLCWGESLIALKKAANVFKETFILLKESRNLLQERKMVLKEPGPALKEMSVYPQ